MKKIKMLLCILLIIFLVSCSVQNTDETEVLEHEMSKDLSDHSSTQTSNIIQNDQKLDEYEYDHMIQSISEYQPNLLLYEDFLEDYDYFWTTLYNTYPFLGVAQRNGVDVDTIMQDGKAAIAEDMDILQFAEHMNNIVLQLNGIGHISLIYPNSESNYSLNEMLDIYKLIYDDTSHYTEISKILREPKAISVYQFLGENIDLESVYKYSTWNTGNALNSNIDDNNATPNCEFEIISEKAAYIKINSFSSTYYADDKNKILEFYNQAKNHPNIIIDIRGNSGGFDDYWIDNIMSLLIDEKLEYTSYALFMDDSKVVDFLSKSYRSDMFQNVESLPNFPKFEKDDLNYLDKYIFFENQINPDDNSIQYKGHIWVLVDGYNYSASESFCMAAKATQFATLVGTQTGGDGGGIDPLVFSMPNSGLLWRHSILYTVNDDGGNSEECGTTPDIIIKKWEEDALEVCLQEIMKN